MPALDIQALLQPLDPDPSGPNLEYDADFVALEEAARGKPEQEYGDTKIPAEPPDFKAVRQLGVDLLKRSKDLRVVPQLAMGLLATDGVSAFCELLQLVQGYLDNFWDSLHPQLDPDDGNDPTWRVNTISSLNDHRTVAALKKAVYVDGGPLGTYSYHDIEVARGEVSSDDPDPPSMNDIEGAMRYEGAEKIAERRELLRQGVEHIAAIEAKLTDLAGAAHATGFDDLNHTLKRLLGEIDSQMDRLDLGGESDGGAVDNDAGGSPAPAASKEAKAPGEIHSRDDVISTLERVCKYYDRHEPSSPIPLLLRRAQRLATMSFLDIVKELTPDGLNQAKSVGGVSAAEGGDED